MEIIDTLPEPYRYEWGVDWVTLTWPPTSEMYKLIKHGHDAVLHGLTHGVLGDDRMEPVKFLGYGGWRKGKYRVGWRKDSAVLIASSHAAMQFLSIPHRDEARCTRLDVKVDCHYGYPRPYILETAYNMSVMAQTGIRGRKWNVELHQPTGKPHWLEIGIRGTGIYIRIYDKEAEQAKDPAYEGVWRIEVEIAKERANDAFHWLISSGGTGRAIQDIGLAHFAERGIRLAGVRPDKWFTIRQPPRPDTDTERTLGWLRKLVRPAVLRLLQHTERDVIIDALGLWDSETNGGSHDGGY